MCVCGLVRGLKTGILNIMKKYKRLWDVYRLPGFVPESVMRGVFGDP